MFYFTTSWDDGSKEDLKVSSLLRRLGLKGTFYIPASEKKRGLSDSEIRKLSKNFEIAESKKILEKISRKKIVSFAYPFGSYNKKTVSAVRAAGYRYARTVAEKKFSTPKNPLLAGITLSITNMYASPVRILRRISSYGSFTFLKALKKIADNAKNNDVIHIAGHSWEFGNEEKFERLENIFEYISQKDVKPITNQEILKIKTSK